MKYSYLPLLFALTFSWQLGQTEEKKVIPALSPEEFLKTVELQEGYYLEPVLIEPQILEPVDIAFDGNGKMYVLEMRTYMQDADYTGEMEPKSVVSLHEDTNGDGKYDKHSIFAKDLVLPRKLILLDGGVVIGETNTHDLYLYKDTNGDGVSDTKELWYEGGARGGNMEHQPHGFVWGLDNWLYSTYNNFRLRYTRGKVEKENIGGNQGQWGITQDDYGKVWYVNAGGERGPIHYQSHIEYGRFDQPDNAFTKDTKIVWPIDNIPDVQGGLRRVREDNTLNHYTATCGQVVFRGDRLPAELKGNIFFSEPVGRLIRRLVITEENGTVKLTHPYHKEKQEFIRSTDPNFRVVNAKTAPDGTMYLVDMYRGIIQQGNWTRPGSYLRGVIDEYGLDKIINHGRIWRLRHKDFDVDHKKPNMLNETSKQLVKHLNHPNGWWREQAQKLIILKGDKSVVPDLIQLSKDGATPLARLHAYWTLEGLDALNETIALAMLKDSDEKVAESGMRLSERFIKNQKIKDEYLRLAVGKNKTLLKQALLSLKKTASPELGQIIEQTVSLPENESLAWLFAGLVRSSPKFKHLAAMSLEEQKLFHKGRGIFKMLCIECHGEDAKGKETDGGKMAPTLINSPRVLGPQETIIEVIMNGLTGPLDGKNYLAGMMFPNKTQNDEWIAAVATYVRNDFGNSGTAVSPKVVSKIRKKTKDRVALWTQSDLEAKYDVSIPFKKDWKLTASHNAKDLRYLFDGDIERRYSSSTKQEAGMWVQIEFPEPLNLSSVFIDAYTTNDYGKSFEFSISNNGSDWNKPIVMKSIKQQKTNIKFKPAKVKSFRIKLLEGSKGSYWSIYEMRLFGRSS